MSDTKTKTDKAKINPQLLDEVLKDYRRPEDFEPMFRQLKKAIVERALGAELTHHLGYSKGEAKPAEQDNHRNGHSSKTGSPTTASCTLTCRATATAASTRN